MPDTTKPQPSQRPQGSQAVKNREQTTQRDRGQSDQQRNSDSGSRQGMQQPVKRDSRHDDPASSSREGQTAGKPGNRDDDEANGGNADEEPIRSGDAAVPGDPAIKHDDDAAGTAPEKKGSPPKFPREVQPRSK